MKQERTLNFIKRFSGIILGGLLVFHFLIVMIYLMKESPVKKQHQYFVEEYISPYFLQTWELFSPPAKSDKILLFHYIRFSKGKTDTVTRNATSNLISQYKNEASTSDRVSYFLYRNTIAMCELNNTLVDSLQKNEHLKTDSAARFKIYNRGIERSLFFSNLYNYSKNCFLKITPREEIKTLDSVMVIISIIDREFPNFEKRSADFGDEANFKTTVWNSRPKRLKMW